MTGPSELTFENDVRQRIYEYVERNGTASPSEIRHQVRIDTGPPASKPARSSGLTAERTPMPVAQVREHLQGLESEGYLAQDGGTYRVAVGDDRATHEVEGGTVIVRPARHEDLADLAAVVEEVASEETYVDARTIAAVIDHEETPTRHNERESRVFFIATHSPDGGDAGTDDADGNNGDGGDGGDGNGEIVGWVHLEGLQLAELRHVAELTVGVVAPHRREGIGKRLLDHGLEWAGGAGYEKLYQTLPATNEEAISFLESEGWEREATHADHYRISDEYVDEALLAIWV
jgi:GNAT superfamily N-acetyltransferase